MSMQQQPPRRAVPSRSSLPAQALRTTQVRYTTGDQRITEEQPTTLRPLELPVRTRLAPPVTADVLEEEEERERRPCHPGRSQIRSTVTEQHPERQLAPMTTPRKPRRQWHPLVFLGGGMLLAALLWVGVLFVGGWWHQQTDTWAYGYPRTYQTDAVVSHGDGPGHPSHFLAENLHGQIVVIEFPGDDPSHGRDFVVTTLVGSGSDLAPVTLSFIDVTGDGKLDMVVHVDGQILVLINDHGTFRPLKPGEQIKPVS
jgi:hypothetical protein